MRGRDPSWGRARGPADVVAPTDPRPTRVSPAGAFGSDSAPPGASEPLPVWIDWPPDQYPPGNAQMRSAFGVATIATGTAWTTLAELQLPANSPGAIRDVEAVASGTIIGTTDVSFRLLNGATTVSGWENERLHPVAGAAALIYSSPDHATWIRLASGQRLTLQARVLSGGPLLVSVRVRGWTWG